MEIRRQARHVADYEVIVAGGGVAGVAAAVSASKMGRRVLLIEKTVGLGGLATTGLINLFVPMCNGRGVQIIRGMAEELLRLATAYGYDTIPQAWKNGEPGGQETSRYVSRFSAPIFTMALTDFAVREGVQLLFDSMITAPVMEGSLCRGLVVENKSGCEYYGAKMVVDASGDADVFFRAGAPTVQGRNFHTYLTHGATLDSCREAAESRDISRLYSYRYAGGRATLFGENHPQGKPAWLGTSAQEITAYLIENHRECLEGIKRDDRMSRTITSLPFMPQFRETRRIDGDYTLREEDAYRHFPDSIAAICDFERRDFLYEVPFRTMVKSGFPNLVAAGRIASARGYAWDVLRVIPPAILTGQAAGIACALAADEGDFGHLDVGALQAELEKANVQVHFDDALIPDREREDTRAGAEGHF